MSSCMTSILLRSNDCALPAEEMAQLITNNGNGFPRFQNMTQRPLLKPPVTRIILLMLSQGFMFALVQNELKTNEHDRF